MPPPSRVRDDADMLIPPLEQYTPGIRVRPARSATIFDAGQTAAIARLYAISRSAWHPLAKSEFISVEPLYSKKFPVTDVPGDTPRLPVCIMVCLPAKVIPAADKTANVSHLPREKLTVPSDRCACKIMETRSANRNDMLLYLYDSEPRTGAMLLRLASNGSSRNCLKIMALIIFVGR